MSPASKNNFPQDWQPTASIKNLHKRAQMLKHIREFFAARDVLEVETPLLCQTSVTDPHIASIKVQRQYLQTSPEYAMKRLLAAGSGAIYQICKAFRQDEAGRLHNAEFTMLEWYRPGFDHHQLMDEMDALFQHLLEMPAAERKTYAAIFHEHLALDPHTADLAELAACAKAHNINVQMDVTERDTWLQLLMSECIEAKLGLTRPCFIYDFPISQAALARIQNTTPPTAARFEVYFQGIELANGFHELQDAKEQRKRFENNNIERQRLGLPTIPIDEYFLAALQHGLPDCAGVALGLDRLIMLAANCQNIAEVISFTF